MSDQSLPEDVLPDENVGETYREGVRFRIQNQKLMLTYKTHLDKVAYKRWLRGVVGFEPRRIEMAWETGKNTVSYPHTHVLIDFGKIWQTTNCRRLDYESIHPHIKKVKTKTHWINSLKYLTKEDRSNDHILKELEGGVGTSIVEDVWNCETLTEALIHCVKSASDASGVIQIYGCKPNEIVVEPPSMRWCKNLIDELKGVPDRRKIIWYCDPIGNIGKTWLCKYLMSLGKDYYCVNQIGGVKDFATIVDSALEGGWSGWCMLFDLPRDSAGKGIYEPLENLKNGLITTTKYRGRSMLLDNPHVVVMANFMPAFRSMSLDRWDLRVFENGGLKQYRCGDGHLIDMGWRY